MAGTTARWGLTTLGPGDALSSGGYKFSDADRHLLDRLLRYACEEHRHTGATATDNTPSAGPTLTLVPGAGTMPSSGRYYYAFTIVDDIGNETAPSPTAVINTPNAVAIPGAPAATALAGSGTLLPGTYSYVCSAYAGANTLETKATNTAAITIPGPVSSNSVVLTLPVLPLGADGLNIYRKTATGLHYLYVTTVPAPTTGQQWTDDGSIEPDCDRALPTVNRTNNTTGVRITYPGATPVLPDGWHWRIYRTTNAFDWSRSFLADVSPQGATPFTPVEYLDVGTGTTSGAPPAVSQLINAPPKINLTNGAEVQGSLPPGVLVTPKVITFTLAGPVTTGVGTFQWICDYDQADILAVRAYLGVDSVPASQPVIVDVNRYHSGTWTSIFNDGAGRPTVPTGQNIGTQATPVHRRLVAGDALTVDVDQAGGGATPTDTDLTVNVLVYVKYGSETTSYTWTT